ncbi:helix-turn-helix domain-containing protein [Flavobacterium macacae]|uniref:Helix-turn-helix domain-containing protein n=1 Tax=Flavobacterium macacae TaxID=2488993 RepID=A0A3P3W0Q2_9FLAO|nr:helix-turn-helix domain-containing protein [Flavobacterium macacae]RRJ88057.1 helix-turn-helix domain-containing protein [Flavobacterium macacae]
MSDKLNPLRIKNLYQMLFEMATGNLSYRLNAKGESLAESLNAFAATMQLEISHSRYVIPHYTYQNLVRMTFILTSNFTIKDVNQEALEILGYDAKQLLDRHFENIIASQSGALWEQLKKEIDSDDNYHATVYLIFLTNEKMFLTAFCSISKTVRSKKIHVSSVATILQDIMADKAGNSKALAPKLADADLAQLVYEYIRGNLENPLPNVQELSKMFGVNDFRLKDSFRHFFGTSIYQCYNEQRLKKAHDLIANTELPLKSIPYSCGFNDYGVFSKAFKKKYQYSPSELFRKTTRD